MSPAENHDPSGLADARPEALGVGMRHRVPARGHPGATVTRQNPYELAAQQTLNIQSGGDQNL